MKKFKNIIYIAILSLLVVSCEDNTDSITNPGALTTVPQEVKVGFIDDNTSAELEEGQTTSYKVGMPVAIDGTVIISINVSSSDGEVEAVFPTSITLEEGQSAKYFDVIPKDDGVSESETYTVEITDVQVSFNTATEFFLHNGDVSRTIVVKDIPIPPTPIDTTVGDVGITLTWGDASRDMDLYLVVGDQDLGGTIVDYSEGITTTEQVTMLSTTLDGTYSVYINQFAFTADVDYIMTFDYPDAQQQVMSGTATQDGFVFTFTKTTSGAVVTYLVNQL